GRRPDPRSDEATAFQEALASAAAARSERDRVIPVRELFHDDAGPHVVHAAPAPATTAEERFRLEAAGAAEHARRLLADARATVQGDRDGAVDAPTVDAAVDALVGIVRSFDHPALADALGRLSTGVAAMDPVALAAADAAAALFVGRRRSVADLETRVADLLGGRVVGTLVSVGYASVERPRITPPGLAALGVTSDRGSARPTPVTPLHTVRPAAPTPQAAPSVPPDVSRPTVSQPVLDSDRAPADMPTRSAPSFSTSTSGSGVTPSGRDLHALLEDGIAGIARLQEEPAAAPSRPTPAVDDVVPVESLLYRGRAALGRAIELRDEIRRGEAPPTQAQLDELFDLLDLAAHP
ncbi:MAG TPA: hypothetical protein VGE02_09810, partial [Gemmatimonadales bacterium]